MVNSRPVQKDASISSDEICCGIARDKKTYDVTPTRRHPDVAIPVSIKSFRCHPGNEGRKYTRAAIDRSGTARVVRGRQLQVWLPGYFEAKFLRRRQRSACKDTITLTGS